MISQSVLKRLVDAPRFKRNLVGLVLAIFVLQIGLFLFQVNHVYVMAAEHVKAVLVADRTLGHHVRLD